MGQPPALISAHFLQRPTRMSFADKLTNKTVHKCHGSNWLVEHQTRLAHCGDCNGGRYTHAILYTVSLSCTCTADWICYKLNARWRPARRRPHSSASLMASHWKVQNFRRMRGCNRINYWRFNIKCAPNTCIWTNASWSRCVKTFSQVLVWVQLPPCWLQNVCHGTHLGLQTTIQTVCDETGSILLHPDTWRSSRVRYIIK